LAPEPATEVVLLAFPVRRLLNNPTAGHIHGVTH